MHHLNRLWAWLSFPYNFLRIELRWKKSQKKGGGLHLRVRNFKALARSFDDHRISYVLLRGNPGQQGLDGKIQEDFDVLADATSIQKMVRLAALVPGKVPIDIYFDRRPSARGFHYYPSGLSERILASRKVHADGYNVPDPEHHFLSLAYHVVYHKGMNDELNRPLDDTVLHSKHYETLKRLAHHPSVRFSGPFTLLGLHEFLLARQCNMPLDVLMNWPLQHPLLKMLREMEPNNWSL